MDIRQEKLSVIPNNIPVFQKNVICTNNWEINDDNKTSKRALNINAIKFKLNRLYTNSIRYEVIYKNLVRDIRKFFSKEFNDFTEFIKKKRKNNNDFYVRSI